MYIVQWCDHEGNLRERKFSRLPDASWEALKLRHRFDGVEWREPWRQFEVRDSLFDNGGVV